MTVTVKINTDTPRGKALVKELRRYPKTVTFENPAETGIVPEGYMTLEEFRIEAKKSITKILTENGIH